MNTNQVLLWFKEFKHAWLPQNIPNNNHLLGLITDKIQELEQLLSQNNQGENDRSIEREYQCDRSSDIEQVVLPTPSAPERSLPTPPDIFNHIDDEIEKADIFCRPAIRLKRISLAEAQRFMPEAWKPIKSKRGRKKGQKNKTKQDTQTIKEILPSTHDESANNSNNIRKSTRPRKNTQLQSTLSLISNPSINCEKKKGKRKLRAIDAEDDDLFTLGNLSQADHVNGDIDCEQTQRYMGQNGILSQTRKINETTTIDDDFTLKLQTIQSTRDETLTSKLSPHPNGINTNLIDESMNILEDGGAMDDEQNFQYIIENNDSNSLFTSLDITRDKTFETSSGLNNNSIMNYNDCIEDISTDGVDPPPSASSPNLAHCPLTT